MRVGSDEDKAIYLAQAALEYILLALVLKPDIRDHMTGDNVWGPGFSQVLYRIPG